jgi:hypothetical protein
LRHPFIDARGDLLGLLAREIAHDRERRVTRNEVLLVKRPHVFGPDDAHRGLRAGDRAPEWMRAVHRAEEGFTRDLFRVLRLFTQRHQGLILNSREGVLRKTGRGHDLDERVKRGRQQFRVAQAAQ